MLAVTVCPRRGNQPATRFSRKAWPSIRQGGARRQLGQAGPARPMRLAPGCHISMVWAGSAPLPIKMRAAITSGAGAVHNTLPSSEARHLPLAVGVTTTRIGAACAAGRRGYLWQQHFARNAVLAARRAPRSLVAGLRMWGSFVMRKLRYGAAAAVYIRRAADRRDDA